MTKGNFVLITDTANWMSTQFNGNMYPSGNGKLAYHMLESVKTYDDLTAIILKFDKKYFGYSNEYGVDLAPKSISDDINFSEDYFAIYNSDYLYIKNASNKKCFIVDREGMTREIQPGEIQVWNYGRLVQPDAEDLELDDDEKKFVYGSEPEDTSFNDSLQTIFEECDSLLENLPKGLTDDEKEILPPVVVLWSALKKYLEK